MYVHWAQVEPVRGEYDAAALAAVRGADRIVLHAGALPDWVIAGGGWLGPDVLAGWGTYVDRVARAAAGSVEEWVTFWSPVEEAGYYGRERRKALRVLADAHAAAYLHLRHGQGNAGRVARVGIAELESGLMARAFVRSLRTGRLFPPLAPFGELPNGTPALDFLLSP